MSKQTPVPLDCEGEELEGVFVGRRDGQARPTVILIPTVMGVSELEIGFGKQLVELGYNAFVADIFGKELHGKPRDVISDSLTDLEVVIDVEDAEPRLRLRALPRASCSP